jgi:hypothetical protein
VLKGGSFLSRNEVQAPSSFRYDCLQYFKPLFHGMINQGYAIAVYYVKNKDFLSHELIAQSAPLSIKRTYSRGVYPQHQKVHLECETKLVLIHPLRDEASKMASNEA